MLHKAYSLQRNLKLIISKISDKVSRVATELFILFLICFEFICNL